MSRYKIIFNQAVEYHVDAINEHKAMDIALTNLRDDGHMFIVNLITIDIIADLN